MSGHEAALGKAPGGYLLVTAAVTGALVMVVEVLGSRVIGPFFGVSLFVWTALITVTLLALAGGYAVGGWLADRHPSPAVLYGLIMAAGFLVASVPLIKAAILAAMLPLGLRAGAFFSALLLFGPALFLLGCVSPYVVRIAAREWGRLGRTVGIFYAISTAGSFVGTLTTGFFLIGYVGVSKAFFFGGLLLILLGAVYFAVFRRRWAVLAAPLVAAALFPRADLPSARTADGTRVTVVHSEDSFYGSIRVVDYRHGRLATRELMIDGLVQGGIDLASGRSVYEYSYLLQFLPIALNPGGRNCLVIGVGAGVVPRWYEARGVATDVVDIDPRVIAVARRYFDYAPRGQVFEEDARYFLASTGGRYDYLILDVFNGDTTPGHLLSLEALRLAKRRLDAGGVMAINLAGSVEAHAEMTAAIVRTLGEVFDRVQVHPVFEVEDSDGTGNMVIVAYDGPPRSLAVVPEEPVHALAEKLVRYGLSRTVEVRGLEAALVLTDDFNPLDVRDIWFKELVRRNILENTPAAILAAG